MASAGGWKNDGRRPSAAGRGAFRWPLVRARRGQSVIYWPALLQTVLVMVGVCVALQLPMAVLFGGKYHPGVFATLVVGGLALLAASIYRGLRTSLDQLTPLDEGKGATGYASASPSAVDDAAEHAREQVRGPAIGLLVTGILNWVALTAAAIFMGWMAFGTKGQPSYTVLIVLPFAFVCSVLMILAALKMKRLDGYWLAVTASVLAIVISPSNLIGLPIGVWALVVLSQADVRTAFRRNRKRATKDRQGRMLGVRLIDVRDGRRVVYWPGVWLVAAVLVIGGLIAVVALYLLFALAFAVFGPQHRGGPSTVVLLCGCFLELMLVFGWAIGFIMLLVRVRDGLAGRPEAEHAHTPPASSGDANGTHAAAPVNSTVAKEQKEGIKRRAAIGIAGGLTGVLLGSALMMGVLRDATLVALAVSLFFSVMVILLGVGAAAWKCGARNAAFAAYGSVVLIFLLFFGGMILVGFTRFLLASPSGPSITQLLFGYPAEPLGPTLVYDSNLKIDSPSFGKTWEVLRQRLEKGKDRLAEVRLLQDGENGRFAIAVLGREDADRRRVERLVDSVGTLEFRILADAHHDKAIIDRALKEPSKSEVLDPSGKTVAWWIPIKAGAERSLPNDPGIVWRSGKQGVGELTQVLVLADPYNLTGGYLSQADAATDHQGNPCLKLAFCTAGAQLLAKLTAERPPDKTTGFASKLGIILNGTLWAWPGIMAAVSDRCEMTGSFAEQEVSDLARILNSGVLRQAPLRTSRAARHNVECHGVTTCLQATACVAGAGSYARGPGRPVDGGARRAGQRRRPANTCRIRKLQRDQ